MGRMRELRRAMTILLSVAMLVTSVPQTGTVALAAELGEEYESKSVSTAMQVDDGSQEDNSGSDDTTQLSDTKENDAEDDSKNTEQPEDSGEVTEDGNEETPKEDSDEVIEDSNEEVPDENFDEVIEDGNEEVPKEDSDEVIEDGGEEISAEDDSISMNALEAKTEAVDALTAGDEPPSEWDAVEEIDQRIIINVGSFTGTDTNAYEDSIVGILEYCAQQGKKYRSFQISGLQKAPKLASGNEVVISKKIVDAARKVWTNQYKDGHISFDTWTNDDVNKEFCLIFERDMPAIEEDVPINSTVEFLPNQGMKLNLSVDKSKLPVDSLQFRCYTDGNDFAQYFGQEDHELGVIRLNDNKVPLELVKDSFGFKSTGVVEVHVDDLNELQSEEYLITPIFDRDEEYALDTPTQLELFIHSVPDTDTAVWTSLNPDMMTISASGELTANSVGEAYYYVTYESDGKPYGELHEVDIVAVTEGGNKLDYVGEVMDNGSILAIDADGRKLTPQKIVAILKYYEENERRFNEIQFYLNGSKERRVSKDVVKAAKNVLRQDEGTLEFDYNVGNGFYSYRLDNPKEIAKDVVLSVNETILANQGIKIKLTANTGSLAEYVSLAIGWAASKNESLDNCLDGADKDLGIFKLSSGTPAARIHEFDVYYETGTDNDSAENRILYLWDLNALQQNAEYLITPVYVDDSVAAGGSKKLEAGIRSGSSAVTSVTWKSLDTDVISINSKGEMTAWEPGGAYYCVKYKADGKAYLEMHWVEVTGQEARIEFDDREITMEPEETKYLRLRFYPSEAERDPGNPDEIMWESSDSSVVRFVEYDEEGKAVPTNTPCGEIQALKAGTATITAKYMVDGQEAASATCTVTVTKPLTYEDVKDQAESLNLYAVTNLDTKLSAIELPEGWSWLEPDTSLANFKNMNGHAFVAVYTDGTGRSIKCNLWVRMVAVTGVTMMTKNDNAEQQADEPAWIDWVPAFLPVGETITLGRSYVIDNYDGNEEYQAIRDRMDQRYGIEWTTSPKNAGTAKGSTYQYTASIVGKKRAAEKKTFTVSMKDKKTKKVLFKASRTITVTTKPVYDFSLVDGPWIEVDEKNQMWLKLMINMPKDDYLKQKLAVVSEDTSILKLETKKTVVTEETVSETDAESEGESEGTITLVSIPCKNPKPGTAWIKVTAPDELKTSVRRSLEFVDKEPKLIGATSVTINKAMTDKSAAVMIRTHEDWPLDTDNISLKLNKKPTESVVCSVEEINQDDGNNCKDYVLTLSLTDSALKDKNLKKGKNTVGLGLTVKSDTGAEEAETAAYTLNLTVNITDKKPSVSFKQAKKVNLFYNDDTGYGVLNVNNGGAEIQDLQLEDSVDKKGNLITCNYELREETIEGKNVYYIVLKEGGNVKNTKGILTYSIEGYDGTFRSAFTVKTENKKPTIVLSAKSDILYPNIWYTDSWLTMFDKATGECIEMSAAESGDDQENKDAVRYVVNKKKNAYTSVPVEAVPEEGYEDYLATSKAVTIKGNNTYKLLVTPDGNIVSRLQGTDAENPSYSKKADKYNLEVKKANWNDWVAVSYSLQVNTSKPKLALGASTLTLNKNSGVYRAQMVRTSLRLKGCNNHVMQDDYNWVTITGQDEKSKKVLRVDNSLVLQYWGNDGDIIARFNNNNIAPGKYKFTVKVNNVDVGTIASTTLTVNVVDSPMTKNLKVSSKGSIDVLNREGTCITYTPKISNLSGEIVDGWLEGRDADLFDAWMENGKLIVHANVGENYSTKNTYQVHAAFLVETRDYDSYTVRTDKPLSIKLKQGKPKLTASTVNNTLYRQLENTVEIKLAAVLNKQAVEIEDVWLLNYTDDFVLHPAITDEEDYSWEQNYNPETNSVTLGLMDRYYADSITKSGKTWKVKLAVRYRDKAGNEKNAEVTCPIVVK